MCINPKCYKLSLLCSNSECVECCQENHEGCGSVSLNKITTMLNHQIQFKREKHSIIQEVERKFMNEMRRISDILLQDNYFGEIGKKYSSILRDIYEKNNSLNLKGKDASQLYSKIKQWTQYNAKIEDSIKAYSQKLKQILELSNQVKNQVCNPDTSTFFDESVSLSCDETKRKRQIEFLMTAL